MPEMPDVIANETVAVEWGNDIRDRTVQRYADLTERGAEHPTPAAGDVAFVESITALDIFAGAAWRSIVPVGAVLPFAGSAVEPGWLLCNGQTVSRTTYARLFAVIGTAYGAGDGDTTFAVPDLRQRFPMGVAASGTGSSRGATGGQINHTHTNPSTASGGNHNHGVTGSTGVGGWLGSAATFQPGAVGPHTHTHSTPSGGAHTHTQGATGSTNPPYVTLHFIIRI